MQSPLFFKLGTFIYKFRRTIIFLWVLIILGGLPFLPNIMAPFQSTGLADVHSESARADRYLEEKFPYSTNQFIVIYHSKTLSTSNSRYIKAMKKSLVGLKDFPIKHEIIYPDMNKKQLSKDKHTAYAVISFDNKKNMTPELLSQFKDTIKTPKQMSIQLGGEPIFIDSINKQTQDDLYHADMIAAPISIIILMLIFGSVVAAVIPVILGGGCAVLILTALYAIGHITELSIFTINIALLLGLCLSLDYSLFIISRFREELRTQNHISDAIAVTLSTAGKAIFFSGLAVFISLSALFLFPVNILFSVAVGGLVAVFIAVFTAIIVLPAVLSLMEARINLLPIRLFKPNQHTSMPLWRKLATTVVNKPLPFFFIALLLLLLLGAPFLKAHIGVADVHILPDKSESRQFFETYSMKFDKNELTPIKLAVSTNHGHILESKNIGKLYDFAHEIKKNPYVKEINSIVTIDNKLTKAQYQHIYSSPARDKDPSINALLKSTTIKQLSVMNIVSDYDANSVQIKSLVKTLRDMNPGPGLTLHVTGVPANNVDVLQAVSQMFPYALAWIMILTYFILLLLLRSVFLPLKAILMNVFSLCATYGVLVFIFQEGHLHQLLHFEPQGMLDISLLVIIFCALFGFSMDYEVFLLTRIQESYIKTKHNAQSIVFGIEHSSRIITSAAIIVIVTCGSFMVADMLMVKEFGLGIAVAIFVDAFIVRSIFVPATMALVKQWNWYLPRWLDRLIPKI